MSAVTAVKSNGTGDPKTVSALNIDPTKVGRRSSRGGNYALNSRTLEAIAAAIAADANHAVKVAANSPLKPFTDDQVGGIPSYDPASKAGIYNRHQYAARRAAQQLIDAGMLPGIAPRTDWQLLFTVVNQGTVAQPACWLVLHAAA